MYIIHHTHPRYLATTQVNCLLQVITSLTPRRLPLESTFVYYISLTYSLYLVTTHKLPLIGDHLSHFRGATKERYICIIYTSSVPLGLGYYTSNYLP